MPDTTIIYGKSYSATTYGGIEVEGNGDTALITFTDHDRNKTKASLKVYTLKQLKKSKEFKSADDENSIDTLVHDWKTKTGKNCIIKYAGDNQLALVFTSEKEVASNFKKIFSLFDFYRVDYLNEIKFETSLRNLTGLTSVKLKEVPGMDEQRIKLLLKSQSGMEKFLAKGVTIEQIAQADISKLEKHLDASYRLGDALNFITIQQVLGISHIPAEINEAVDNDNGFRFAGGTGGGTLNDFSYKHDGRSITVTHDESKTKLEISFGVLKAELVPPEEQLSELTPNDMVHKWYTIGRDSNKASQMVTLLYSPEMRVIHKESVDKDFPENAFKTDMNGFYTHMLYTSPFYKEVAFVEFLKKKGASFEALKTMQGMSQRKLALMLSNKFEIESLLDKGMTFEDFAKVDEKRFSYVMTHFNKAKSALEFVDPYELFGLGARPQRRFGLFDASASQAPVIAAAARKDNDRRQCVVM